MPLDDSELIALQWGISCLSMVSPPATPELRVRGKVGSNFVWVTVYSPHVFLDVREAAGVSFQDFQKSLTADLSGGRRASISKSGSLFFKSSCDRFLLKTIHSEEMRALQYMVDGYAEHIKSQPTSILSRVLAAYRTRVHTPGKLKPVIRYFVVQLNIFPPEILGSLKAIYDMKGTTENRLVKEEVFQRTKMGKDLNLKEVRVFFLRYPSQSSCSIMAFDRTSLSNLRPPETLS